LYGTHNLWYTDRSVDFERAIKNEKLATLGTQDTILVLIYISVNKCMLSYTTLSVSTFMMFNHAIEGQLNNQCHNKDWLQEKCTMYWKTAVLV
jgi:hypothetical protein